MDRRAFLGAAGAALAGRTAAAAARPNILLIYTDEHSAWTLGAYGGTLIPTPNLDRIAREGAVCDNFFVNSAVCTPSRGCLITGRYPHAHGAHSNNLPINQDEVTLAEVLRRAGYATAMAGKWHLDGEGKPGWIAADRAMGFEDYEWMYNRGHWKRIIERPRLWPRNRSVARFGGEEVIAEEPDRRPDVDYGVEAPGEYFTDWLADKFINYVQRPRDKPFFYYLSIPDPHTPFTVRAPYDRMFDPADMPVPETLYEKDLPDWAETARQGFVQRDKAESAADPKRERLLRERLAQYCGMVKCIDDNVGRILDVLEREGILDDTLILFTSDHGNYLGEHGLYFKNQLYETAHRVAFFARLPGVVPAGTRVEECVSAVDVQRTVLSLVGVEPSGREQGGDFSKLLRGVDDPACPNEAFIHHSSLKRAGIFTPDWQLGLVKDGEGILFDRRNDPQQTNNLFGDRTDVVAELKARVVDHHREVDSPALGWLADS